MKLIEFIKKYQLVLILSFLVVVLIIVKFLYRGEDKKEIIVPVITPTPTVLIEPTVSVEEFKTEIGQEINYNYPLAQILPYSTENFKIERYTKPLVIEVEALNSDQVLVEKEVVEWINKNGSTAEKHKIVWK
ncbi:MAG: hypothetical protein PHO75_01405 [Candidatus Shapirobacteria bacterium]|jgi:hypothetical protein|nr:hypothetical protein [Candidatus Shapirobacteria bacterium]